MTQTPDLIGDFWQEAVFNKSYDATETIPWFSGAWNHPNGGIHV